MAKAAANENSRNFYQLVRNTGPRKSGLSGVIEESDGAIGLLSRLSADMLSRTL